VKKEVIKNIINKGEHNMATKIINGKEVEVIPAVAKEIVKHKSTGKVYASKAEFDKDVADSNTPTTEEDFSQHVEITVASLSIFGKTK
tara:strand:+ start:1526 stop:1789 length:264 start_codon:yes stop_codon:yes gene_type:complete